VFNGIGSRLSVLDYVQVFYRGSAGTAWEGVAPKANVLLINGTHPTISNSAIAKSGGVGIYVDWRHQRTRAGKAGGVLNPAVARGPDAACGIGGEHGTDGSMAWFPTAIAWRDTTQREGAGVTQITAPSTARCDDRSAWKEPRTVSTRGES
jgi:hypothetical protein